MRTSLSLLTVAVALSALANLIRSCDTTSRFDAIESLLQGMKAESRKCNEIAERKALK
jgi:hypothetical protein